MEGLEVYIQVMKDSLKEKQEIMKQLLDATIEQKEVLHSDSSKAIICDAIMAKVDEKAELLKRLEFNDSGFEKVYRRVRDDLMREKDKYRTDIMVMDDMIKKIVDDSVKLQALEMNNKEQIDTFLKSEREKVKSFNLVRANSKAYYQHMANQHQPEQSYFLDSKH